jgi:Tol biopolymer transport system component
MATSRHIWRIPVDPTLGKATGTSVKVTDGAAEYTSPNLWRGGSRLVYASNRSGETNVWLRDLKSGSDTQLTLVQGWEYLPLLSPGGNEVAFCRGHSGRGPLLFLDVASRIERKVLDNVHAPMGWSADGKRFFYIAGEALVLRVVDLASGQTGDFIKHPQYPVRQGAVSPDGRWISFRLVTGRDHTPIFVAPLQGENPPPESAWTRIADGPNDESWWSPDGSLIYFLSRRDGYRCLWSQRLNPTTKRPLEAPQLVQDFHKRLRVVGGLSFGSAAGTDSLYCGLRETTGRIWLMRTSE